MDEDSLSGKLFEEEEFPLIGRTLDGIYEILELIGGGGMCQVYKARINIHRYKANEIIKGNFSLNALALSHSELNLDEDHTGPITDSEQIKKINERADMLSSGFENIIQQQKIKRPGRSRDSSRLMHQRELKTADADFRATGNIVALKILRKSARQNEDLATRFDKEAQACQDISHQNIIKSIGSGKTTIQTDDGPEKIHHFAMEYVDPYDFEQHNEKNPLATKLALEILKGTSNACVHLHKNGNIHRDIKPSNILVHKQSIEDFLSGKTTELDVRLSDFGLAKVHQVKKQSSSITDGIKRITKVTKAGQILGTAPYMSPEQIDDTAYAGGAADDWSLSASLYELLTGHLPYGDLSSNPISILTEVKAMRERPKHIKCYNSDVSQTLEDLIMMNFTKIDVLTKKIKTTDQETGEEIWKVLDVITNDEGMLLYTKNDRLTSEERSLAISDYQSGKKEYFKTLDKLKRQPINKKGEYDASTVRKRIETLEQAINKADYYLREGYLEKMLIYEQSLPTYHESTPEESSKWKKPLLYSFGVAALVGGILTSIFLPGHLNKIGTYKTIKSNIQILAAQELEKGNFEKTFNLIEESKIELKRLPAKYMDAEEIINSFETEAKQKQQEIYCTTTETLIQEAYSCLKKRQFPEAQSKTKGAKKQMEEISSPDKVEELKKQTDNLDKKLSAKRGSIRAYDFVTEEYTILQKECQVLQKDLEDGAPFAESKKIEQMLIDIDRKKLMLGDVKDDFVENEEPVKEYAELEQRLSDLEVSVGTLGFEFANEYLALSKKSIMNIPQSTPEEEPEEKKKFEERQKQATEQARTILDSAESLTNSIKKIYSNSEKLDQFIGQIELTKKALNGDSTPREILFLEDATQNPENYIYVRNGVTSETITEYTQQAVSYLSGENMRADMYVQVTLDSLGEKLPKQRESIQKVKQQAKPLFDLSRKIQQLRGELDTNPEDKDKQKELAQTTTTFTETTKTLKPTFEALNTELTTVMKTWTRTADAEDYISLGDAYSKMKDKKRALQSYKTGLMLTYLGFPTDTSIVKETLKKLKQLEQK